MTDSVDKLRKKFFQAVAIIIALVATVLTIFTIQKTSGNSVLELFVNFAVKSIEDIGYLGVFFLMILESALVPIPSEVVMMFSGFLISMGKMNFTYSIAAGTVGNLLGSILLFYIGKKFGIRFFEKYGKFFFITDRDLSRANRLFERHGSKIIFFGRMMPAVRTVISLPAGIARMDIQKFALYTLLGSIPWNALLVYLGYLFGSNWSSVLSYLKYLDYLGIIVLCLLIGLFYYYRGRDFDSSASSKTPI